MEPYTDSYTKLHGLLQEDSRTPIERIHGFHAALHPYSMASLQEPSRTSPGCAKFSYKVSSEVGANNEGNTSAHSVRFRFLVPRLLVMPVLFPAVFVFRVLLVFRVLVLLYGLILLVVRLVVRRLRFREVFRSYCSYSLVAVCVPMREVVGEFLFPYLYLSLPEEVLLVLGSGKGSVRLNAI